MIKSNIKYFAVMATCLLLSLEAVCFGTTYYVDGSHGSDSNSGQSTTAAWQTLNKANTTLRAGDTVLIRAGTYTQVINPSSSGVAGAPITYQNYAGEAVMVRGVSGQVAPVNLVRSYIVVDGLTLKHLDPSSVSRGAGVYIWGEDYDHNTIRNCNIVCQGPGTYNGSREYGIRVSYADYTLIENNTIRGWPILGIVNGYGASHTTIRGNQIINTQSSAIDIGGGSYGPHYILIENNFIDYCYQEDGIQFENNYNLPAGTIDYDSNQKVIIRNNVFRYCQENAVDLKGAANIVIEGNTFYGCPYDNEGPGDGPNRYPGAGCIVHGSGTGSRDVIIRHNIIYDNAGGILVEAGYQIYQNTIVYNNRDYTGSNSSWVTTNKPAFTGIAAWNTRGNVNIKNNILGGHNSAEVAVRETSPSLTIDGNLYFNDRSPLLVHYVGDSNWHVETWTNWPLQLANPILALGDDVHAMNADPRLVNVPADPGGEHTRYDFNLQSTSPAIDAGQFLTTARGSGSGTSLGVVDSRYFCDGYGLVPGDTIQLQGQTTRARITAVDYSTHTLTLATSLSWTKGQGVALAYSGSRPDIGAREYGGTVTTYSLNVSATNGTVTKTPDQTSYTSGQTVTLTAAANSGYTFSGWSGDLTGTTNPATLVMNANQSVTATFTSSGGTGGTLKEVGNTTVFSAINKEANRRAASCTMPEAGQLRSISVYHEAGSGQMLLAVYADSSGLPGTQLGVTNATTVANSVGWQTVALQSPVSVSAGQSIWLAWVFENNPGVRAVAGTPGRANSTATWSGGMPGTFGTSSIADYIYSIYANYNPASTSTSYTLTTSATNGTITRSPNQASYTSGQTVTLTATPNAGYTFSGWSGDLTGTTNPATLVMDANKSVTANFTANLYTLSVSATNGSVTTSPSAASYTYGQVVTLQAVPDAGYTFTGWSGDLTGTTNPATLVMNANKSVTANFTANLYTLSVSATNGSVTTSPSAASYTYGQVVALQAVPDAGYTFTGWSGDLTGTTNPATLVMNANKSVTANFTANSYTLSVSATNGSVTTSPSAASYTYGQVVTLQAVPDAGYTFTGWSGDASGTSSTITVVMDANKAVTANFTAARYVLTISAVHGVVTESPSQTSYTYGQVVTLQAVADPNYVFTGWSGDASGTSPSTTVTMDADKTVVANFATQVLDQKPPVLTNCSPAPDAIQVPPNTLVVLHLGDEGEGVDAASVSIRVNSHLVQTGDVDTCRTDYGVCRRLGTKADYTYVFQPAGLLGYSRKVSVVVNGRDLAGNTMPEAAYSFATEMHSFGLSKTVAPDQTRVEQGQPATVGDRQGNIWVVWQAGVVGERHIYVARLAPDADAYDPAVQLSRSTGDHCNPALTLDAAGTLYAVWQENPRGVWDICLATSVDGATWSAPKRIVDPMLTANQVVDQVHPAVSAGRQSSNLVAVAWQDNRAGNQDIYVACSTNAFATATIARVTSDSADQIEPVVAVDGQDTVFVLWTDTRTGVMGVYGAASNSGPWTNVPVTAGPGGCSQPALAVGWASPTLHIAWVNVVRGDPDIFYASSPGLPASPLEGTDIVDDTAAADQQAPVLVVATQVQGTDHVFVCWQDGRNVAFSGDTDLYCAEVSPGALTTNVLISDEGTNSNQSDVAMTLDGRGYPYLVWNDSAGKSPQISSAGATYMESVPLAEKEISATAGGIVGPAPERAVTLNDVSVAIPPQACPFDATVSIRRLRNPRTYATESLRVYDFGPSGLTFTQPVTITIPYDTRLTGKARASWFDSATSAFTSEGITNVQNITLASGLHALQFNATHFTPYTVVADGRRRGDLPSRQKTSPRAAEK